MNASGKSKRFQFSVGGLLLLTAIIALLLFRIQHQDRSVQVEFICIRLPANDQELKEWYESHPGVASVEVTRRDRTVTVDVWLNARGGIGDRPKLDTPPLNELGYDIEAIAIGQSSLLGAFVAGLLYAGRAVWISLAVLFGLAALAVGWILLRPGRE